MSPSPDDSTPLLAHALRAASSASTILRIALFQNLSHALPELLKLLRILRLKDVPSDSSLEQLVLHSLQQTLMENTRSQNFFRVIGGLQVLLDGLGTPSSEGDGRDAGVRDILREERNVGEPGTPCEKDCIDKVSVEFGLQLLSLQVLREAIFRNHISLQSMREHGGVHKFAQMISWAAFTTPDVTAKKKLSTQFNIGKSVRMNLSPGLGSS